MFKIKLIFIVVLCLYVTLFPAFAGDFDGSKKLLGTVTKIIEIHADEIITDLDPESVGVPRFFIIDFKERILRPTKESLIRRTIKIERIEHIENKLILQGADEGIEGVKDGLGWSMAIPEETGKMVLTASGDGVAFVVFGTCTPL